MEEAVRLNGFPNLQEFNMKYCHALSGKSIDCLLKLDTPLKKMNLTFFELESEEKIAAWKNEKNWENQIKENNWDLSITMQHD